MNGFWLSTLAVVGASLLVFFALSINGVTEAPAGGDHGHGHDDHGHGHH
jgi:hypothetical protein